MMIVEEKRTKANRRRLRKPVREERETSAFNHQIRLDARSLGQSAACRTLPHYPADWQRR